MRGGRAARGFVNRAGKIEGTNYTGDQNGVLSPWGGGAVGASTPSPGASPTIPLILDENDDGSSVMDRVDATARRDRNSTRDSTKAKLRWPLMILANFIAWLMLRVGVTAFGDGTDGSATLDGVATVPWATNVGSVYTLTQDPNLVNLTINNGVTLKYGGYRLYGTGTLTIQGTGLLSASGNDAIGSTGGAALPANTAGGAPAGAVGGTSGGTQGGNDGTGSSPGWGGNGGGGGGSSSNGGLVTPAAANKGRPNTAFGPLMGILVGGNGGAPALTLVNGGASGGSGGTANAGSTGGGGGGAGGVGMCSFRRIRLATATNMMAAGGAGGTPATGDGKGGGGGGGGYQRVVCMDMKIADGTTMSAVTNCPGGAGAPGHGLGASFVGANGGFGRFELVNLVSLLA